MKHSKVNWESVEIAFERNSPELQSYIDRESGEVLVIVDGHNEDEELRRHILEDTERFIKIEPAASKEQYRWMERFVASVQEPQLRDHLLLSIDGKGAFRRFKDALLNYPQERERWFNFRANLLHFHINQWFATKGLIPDPPSPWGEVQPPAEPEQPEIKVPLIGPNPIDLLRSQVKHLVDTLPSGELHSARVFLEFLRDRGVTELVSPRVKFENNPSPIPLPFENQSKEEGVEQMTVEEIAVEDVACLPAEATH